jgi:hypothetical protein
VTEPGTFVVYAEWLVEVGPASDGDQAVLADLLATLNPCVWVEDAQPDLILASVDVQAPNLDAALEQGREAVMSAAREARLAGSLARLTAMDEDGYLQWP